MGRYRVLPIGSVAMATIIVVRHYGSEREHSTGYVAKVTKLKVMHYGKVKGTS